MLVARRTAPHRPHLLRVFVFVKGAHLFYTMLGAPSAACALAANGRLFPGIPPRPPANGGDSRSLYSPARA